MKSLDLLPPPQKIKMGSGVTAQRRVQCVLESVGRPEVGAYRLSISKSETKIHACDEEGLFYAAQTLAQIDRQFPKARPCLEILDWPDYPVRGFYHDVTRGKVPKLKTLLQLAETCASYKLNHLELYIEHTFAFKKYPKVWRDADPLTADEIQALDARCAELHIDLVPSFSTFGHFYTWIRQQCPELNELERDVSKDPFHWVDRMAHDTLDCQNPKSLELVRNIIREVRPLFRSKYFNICCDETFDLGIGKNQELAKRVGKGRLYLEFLKKIMAVVKEVDAIPLFWGDIIGHSPELLSEISKEAIALDWDYSPTLEQNHAKLFQKSKLNFMVCPGVSGWNQWLPRYAVAHENITRLAKLGRKCGAQGLLNTDWGDYGHINTLGPTLPGLALGASVAWNTNSRQLTLKNFEPIASRMILGDASGELLELLREIVQVKRGEWDAICWSLEPRPRGALEEWYDAATGLSKGIFRYSPKDYLKSMNRVKKLRSRIEKKLTRCKPDDPILVEELRVGLLGIQVIEELYVSFQVRAGKIKRTPAGSESLPKRIRELERRLGVVWKKRNKPSEFYRIREVLKMLAQL